MKQKKRLFSTLSSMLIGCIFFVYSGDNTLQAASSKDFNILAKDSKFAIVRLKETQSYSDLADFFMGDAKSSWQILELNGPEGSTGQVVAVPLSPVNQGSIYTNGYRTIPILCYHQFTAEDTTTQRLEVSAKEFDKQMQYLKSNDFTVLKFSDLEDIYDGRRPIPDKAVVITIDDGYKSVYDVAFPILQKYNIHSTLFAYTDFMGGSSALSWQQLKSIRESGIMDIQSHSKTHASLSKLPSDTNNKEYNSRLHQEIEISARAFEKRLGFEPIYFAFPYGNSSDKATDMLKKNNYKLAATVTRGDNGTFVDPFLLHRTMIYDNHDMNQFKKFVTNFKAKNLK
ncbi:MAG: polysaccharide deacetylase family protein [Pseudomonadales bacterium]